VRDTPAHALDYVEIHDLAHRDIFVGRLRLVFLHEVRRKIAVYLCPDPVDLNLF
jgi:hypothetical protein